jgi:nucleoside-diphosphate-sugar epimerase
MRYLVTGGGGFIGAYVVRVLLRQVDSVVIYDRYVKRNAINEVLTPEELGRVATVQGDISDAWRLSALLRKYEISHIIHTAAPLSVATETDPCLAEKTMCLAQAYVLESARLFDLERVVWTSSVAVFGPKSLTRDSVPNDAPHDPQNLYGACKSHCEYLAEHYYDEFGVDSIGLRLATVYGPWRQRGDFMFLHDMIAKPALGLPCKVPFGDEVFNWQYVEDVAELCVAASRVGQTRRRNFNTGGEIRCMQAVVDCIRRLIPSAQIDLKPGRTGIPWVMDTTALDEEVGYRPTVSMEDRLKESIEIIRLHAKLEPMFK